MRFMVYVVLKKNLNASRPSEHPPVRGVDDSHIQHINLAAEETKVTQQKSDIDLSNANPSLAI